MSWFHRILYICLQTRFQKEAGKIYMLFGFFGGFRFKLDAKRVILNCGSL